MHFSHMKMAFTILHTNCSNFGINQNDVMDKITDNRSEKSNKPASLQPAEQRSFHHSPSAAAASADQSARSDERDRRS